MGLSELGAIGSNSAMDVKKGLLNCSDAVRTQQFVRYRRTEFPTLDYQKHGHGVVLEAPARAALAIKFSIDIV